MCAHSTLGAKHRQNPLLPELLQAGSCQPCSGGPHRAALHGAGGVGRGAAAGAVPGARPAGAMAAQGPGPAVVKPAIDTQRYRHVVLANQLQAVLISDDEADKAGAAMDVRPAEDTACCWAEMSSVGRLVADAGGAHRSGWAASATRRSSAAWRTSWSTCCSTLPRSTPRRTSTASSLCAPSTPADWTSALGLLVVLCMSWRRGMRKDQQEGQLKVVSKFMDLCLQANKGGHTNAYTASESTNYQFDCNWDALGPALDRFAQVRLHVGGARS